jgi:hypothetical protein
VRKYRGASIRISKVKFWETLVKHKRFAALVACLVWVAGCTQIPIVSQPVKHETLAIVQPVDVKGYVEPLRADFVHSDVGGRGAAACRAAIPGVGILLAALCSGIMGTTESNINTSRSNAAQEMVRPLKEVSDNFAFDRRIRESLMQSLKSAPNIELSDIVVMKVADSKAPGELFMASRAGSVLFTNVNYRLTTEFSALILVMTNTLIPRSDQARVAAGLPDLQSDEKPESFLATKNAVYRSEIIYRVGLTNPSKEPGENVATWGADGGRLLQAAMIDGIGRTSEVLAEDIQGKYETKPDSESRVNIGGIRGNLLVQDNAGTLLRTSNGSLLFSANLDTAAAHFDASRRTASAKPARNDETLK